MPSAAHTQNNPRSDHERGDAADLGHDPANGVDCFVLAEQVKTDPRVTYTIFSGRIFKARTGKWEIYRGINRHAQHMHVSIRPESRNDLNPWPWSPNGRVTPRVLKVEAPMMKGEDVLKVQMRLGMRGYTVAADAVYGYGTESVVKKFQEDNGLTVDGVVGIKTRKVLGL